MQNVKRSFCKSFTRILKKKKRITKKNFDEEEGGRDVHLPLSLVDYVTMRNTLAVLLSIRENLLCTNILDCKMG